jgi:hypothetical protein
METKGSKILKNVKIYWMFILSPTVQHVMVEYKSLFMKMAFNGPTNDKANFDFFCDV